MPSPGHQKPCMHSAGGMGLRKLNLKRWDSRFNPATRAKSRNGSPRPEQNTEVHRTPSRKTTPRGHRGREAQRTFPLKRTACLIACPSRWPVRRRFDSEPEDTGMCWALEHLTGWGEGGDGVVWLASGQRENTPYVGQNMLHFFGKGRCATQYLRTCKVCYYK